MADPHSLRPERDYGKLITPAEVSTTPSAEERISELLKPLAEAGFQLANARRNCEVATRDLRHWEQQYFEISEQVIQLMHDHRNASPKGV